MKCNKAKEFCFACGEQHRKGEHCLLGRALFARQSRYTACYSIALWSCQACYGSIIRWYTTWWSKLSTRYIRKPCFRDMERLQNLQQQLRIAHERLYATAKNAILYMSTPPASSHSRSALQIDETQDFEDNSSNEDDRCSTSELVQKRSFSPPS